MIMQAFFIFQQTSISAHQSMYYEHCRFNALHIVETEYFKLKFDALKTVFE